MKHMAMIKDWNRNTRSERIKSVVETLICLGEVEVEYIKGRSYIASLFLGEGNPIPVDEKGEWNQVRIACKGKIVLKILDSRPAYEGYLFDENYTEDENRQIEDALANVGFLTWQRYVSKSKWKRSFHFFGALWGFFIIIFGYIRGDYIYSILGLCLLLCFLFFLLRK